MNTSIYVQNIKCHGCANTIKSQLEKINGIEVKEISPEKGLINMDLTDDSLLAQAKKRLQKLGYPEGDPTLLDTAKSYVSCMIGRLNN